MYQLNEALYSLELKIVYLKLVANDLDVTCFKKAKVTRE
jgi:hypothetical protein